MKILFLVEGQAGCWVFVIVLVVWQICSPHFHFFQWEREIQSLSFSYKWEFQPQSPGSNLIVMLVLQLSRLLLWNRVIKMGSGDLWLLTIVLQTKEINFPGENACKVDSIALYPAEIPLLPKPLFSLCPSNLQIFPHLELTTLLRSKMLTALWRVICWEIVNKSIIWGHLSPLDAS